MKMQCAEGPLFLTSDALGAFLNANGRSFSAAFNLAHSYLVRPYLLLYRPCDEVRRIIMVMLINLIEENGTVQALLKPRCARSVAPIDQTLQEETCFLFGLCPLRRTGLFGNANLWCIVGPF